MFSRSWMRWGAAIHSFSLRFLRFSHASGDGWSTDWPRDAPGLHAVHENVQAVSEYR